MSDKTTAEGYSLVEVLIVIAIIVTIAAIAVPNYNECVNNARVVCAISDIRKIQTEIDVYMVGSNALPKSLDDLNLEYTTDPWGNPYQYLVINGRKTMGSCRKDRSLVPLNSDYDLYSKGRDGESKPPITAKPSQDDIVRASNGSFIGPASNY
jgi:general secretion pathway protein G